MILRRAEATDPLCERCLKLQKVVLAVVAFELADDEQTLAETARLPDPTLYSRGFVSFVRSVHRLSKKTAGRFVGVTHPATRSIRRIHGIGVET